MLCFRKFPVARKFMNKRGGGVSRFSVEFFCLAVPKNAVGEPFSLSLLSGIEKIWMRGWGLGECQDFPSKFSCLTVPKIFVGQPFRVSLISGIENFYASEGYVTIFCRTFLSHSAEKCRRGTLQSFITFGYRKNLDERVGVGGVPRVSVEIFVSHSAENFRRATL